MEDKLTSPLVLDHGSANAAKPDVIELPPISDYYKWSADQARHIRDGRFDLVDKLNVADEIEDVGKRERRSIVSGLEQILTHMLKWDHQPMRRSRSWIGSIVEHRMRVIDDLGESPSLQAQQKALVARAYKYACLGAARQTKVALSTFPVDCPYTWDQIMDTPYELDRD